MLVSLGGGGREEGGVFTWIHTKIQSLCPCMTFMLTCHVHFQSPRKLSVGAFDYALESILEAIYSSVRCAFNYGVIPGLN